MTHFKKLSNDGQFGRLKNSLIKGTAIIHVIDDSLTETKWPESQI